MKEFDQSPPPYRRARRRCADYYRQYAIEHAHDRLALNAENDHLLASARFYRDEDDFLALMPLRDALQHYLDSQGRWTDSLRLNEWTADLARALSDLHTVARVTHDSADIRNQMGEYNKAERMYESSEETHLRIGDERSALFSRHMRSMVVRAQGRLAQAQALCESVVEQAERIGLNDWLAHPLYVRALLARDRGDWVGAQKWVEFGLSHLSVDREPVMVAQCHGFLGEVAMHWGHMDIARSHLEFSLELNQKAQALRGVSATRRLLADLAWHTGYFSQADQLYREAFSLAIDLGDRPQQARIHYGWARMLAAQKRWRAALVHMSSAASLYHATGDPRSTAGALLWAAQLAVRLRQWHTASRLIWDAIATVCGSRVLRPRVLLAMLRIGMDHRFLISLANVL